MFLRGLPRSENLTVFADVPKLAPGRRRIVGGPESRPDGLATRTGRVYGGAIRMTHCGDRLAPASWLPDPSLRHVPGEPRRDAVGRIRPTAPTERSAP
jgi:hypothetical protein